MILPAAPWRFKNSDSEYRYRPDSELYYLTGWELPECIALLRSFADRRLVLFVPERDPARELWTGGRPDPEEVAAAFGADEVLPLADFRGKAPRMLADGGPIHYRLGTSRRCDDAVRAALRLGRSRRARRGAGARALVDPGAVLDQMRLRKDDAEIARIREAARITVAAFREALGRVRPGAWEWEVEAALEGGFRRRGADGPAFATIVAAGASACTLHYTDNSRRIGAEGWLLMDAGAEFEWYAADVTRTVPAAAARRSGPGAGQGLQREAYQAVLEARRAAVAACVPGGRADAVHEAASRALAEGLTEMGVLAGPADEVLERGDQRAFFPHRTSHWLGLDTHDVGNYVKQDGKGVRLEPGMVLTVEPGLYFRPEASVPSGGEGDAVRPRLAPGGARRLRELEGLGIRVEDDVLVDEGGAEVLTAGLPVDLHELEPLVGTAS